MTSLLKKAVIFQLVLVAALFPVAGQTGSLFAQTIGEIAGNVVGIDGKPLLGIKVEAVDAATTDAVVASTTTGVDGRFQFKGLEAGKTYRIQATHGLDKASKYVKLSPTGKQLSPTGEQMSLKLSKTKGFWSLNAGKWVYVVVAVVVAAGAGVGIAAAAGAFDGGKDRAASPSSP